MIKIDLKQFIRAHVWFGWMCVHVMHDGGKERAIWRWSQFNRRRFVPVAKTNWMITHYDKDPHADPLDRHKWVPRK